MTPAVPCDPCSASALAAATDVRPTATLAGGAGDTRSASVSGVWRRLTASRAPRHRDPSLSCCSAAAAVAESTTSCNATIASSALSRSSLWHPLMVCIRTLCLVGDNPGYAAGWRLFPSLRTSSVAPTMRVNLHTNDMDDKHSCCTIHLLMYMSPFASGTRRAFFLQRSVIHVEVCGSEGGYYRVTGRGAFHACSDVHFLFVLNLHTSSWSKIHEFIVGTNNENHICNERYENCSST